MKIEIEVKSFSAKQLDRIAKLYAIPDGWEDREVIEFLIEHSLVSEHDLDIDLDFSSD